MNSLQVSFIKQKALYYLLWIITTAVIGHLKDLLRLPANNILRQPADKILRQPADKILRLPADKILRLPADTAAAIKKPQRQLAARSEGHHICVKKLSNIAASAQHLAINTALKQLGMGWHFKRHGVDQAPNQQEHHELALQLCFHELCALKRFVGAKISWTERAIINVTACANSTVINIGHTSQWGHGATYSARKLATSKFSSISGGFLSGN